MGTLAFMGENKSIIIGCDNPSIVPLILAKFNGITKYACLLASRSSDVVSLAKSVNPALVILSFRDNQSALNTIGPALQNYVLPFLCLLHRDEEEGLCWDRHTIVFTYPLEYAIKKDNLQARIRSILLLKKSFQAPSPRSSFAQQAQGFRAPTNSMDMGRYVLELDQKKAALLRIKQQIKELYPKVGDPIRVQLMSIVNSIKASTTDQKHWEDFKRQFERISPMFLQLLSKKHPSLTPMDIKYCCYLNMDMSNDDIRHILGINQESVRTHKYRLKKKLALPKDQDLRSYVKSLNVV